MLSEFSTLSWILSLCALACVLSLAAGAGYLLLPSQWRSRTLSYLISFATGTLLGVSFLELLPHAIELQPAAGVEGVMGTVLAGILVFFVLEKALIWRHAHHGGGDHGHQHAHPSTRNAGALIMVGDTFHNFLDGVLLTAVFVSDVELGVITGLAMIAHEIPQELGDFAIMIESGFSRLMTFTLNAVSSLAMLAGALLAWWAIATIQTYLAYVLAFTSASFIYIAVADLIPALHRGVRIKESLWQLVLIESGILLVAAFHHA
ncbi:MAG: ZIP family metal transporter [Gammaproteobacteria bacterium]|nr:ZIP family metal transporter [Gammaproteobacteria bacterium]